MLVKLVTFSVIIHINDDKVAGFPVFGCAQPTEEGFGRVLEKVPRGTPEKPIKTVW